MNALYYFNAVKRLVFPHTCKACGAEIFQTDQLLCVYCIKQLPYTNFHRYKANVIENIFAGRLNVEKASSWLFFSKDGLTQHLIHRLKYRNDQSVGFYLGKLMGKQLQESNWLQDIDVLIPLPLNARKLRIRGYNQSAVLCNGIGKATNLPVEEVAVMRTIYTHTQTRKTRLQRWANVEHVFDLLEASHLHNKHALLVDDVITTGATMDACGQVLLKVPGLKLSILSLALASKV